MEEAREQDHGSDWQSPEHIRTLASPNQPKRNGDQRIYFRIEIDSATALSSEPEDVTQALLFARLLTAQSGHSTVARGQPETSDVRAMF